MVTAGIVTIKYRKRDAKYGRLRPVRGISDIGLKNIGPMPYPKTYIDNDKDTTCTETPYVSIRIVFAGVMMDDPT